MLLEYCKPGILEALGPTWPARCFKVSLNSKSQSHTQSPCKPDNCCVFNRNNDIMVNPSVHHPTYSVSLRLLQHVQVPAPMHKTKKTLKASNPRMFSRHLLYQSMSWNNIAMQPVCKHNVFVNSMSLTSTTPRRSKGG